MNKLLPEKEGPERGKTWGEVKNSPGSKVKFYNPNVRFGGDSNREKYYKELMLIPADQRTKQQQRELKNIMDWDYQSEYRTALDMPEYFESIYGEGYVPTYRQMRDFLNDFADPVAIGESEQQQQRRGFFNDVGRAFADFFSVLEEVVMDDTKRPSRNEFNNILDISIAESVNAVPEKERGNVFGDLGNIVLDQIDQSIEYATTSLGPKVKELASPIMESLSGKPELVAPKTGEGPQNVMRDSARAAGTPIAQPRVDAKVEGLKGVAAPKPSKVFGQTGPRQISNIQERDGKLFGTVSGSGTSPYQIQVKPDQYGGVKAGDTINYNPAQDPKAFTITSGGTTTAGKKPGPTLAEVQAQRARANPAAQPKDSPYLKNMQKQDGFDYGGFAPGFSRRPSGRRPSLGERPTPPAPKRDRPSYTPDRMPIVGEGKTIEGFNYETQRGQEPELRNLLRRPDDKAEPRTLLRRPDDTADPIPADNPKGRYDSMKQRDLQRTPAPPTLKNMQKYQAWVQKAEEEGAMAKVQLDRVSDLASMMHDILEDEDQLPGWIQNKISDSLHNLEASMTHIMYDEKEDRDLVKSKEIFQDFLVRAPQGGGEHLEKVAPIVPAVVRTAAPFAFLKIAPKLAKFVGKLFGKKNAKDVTKETLENTAKKGFTKKQAAFLAAPVAGAYLVSQGTDDPDEKAAMDEMQKFGQDLQNSINDQIASIGQGIQDKYGSLSTEIADFQAKVQEPPQPSPSNQQIGDGLTDRELGRRGVDTLKPSYTQPIYDTSPEAEARVRAGGSESIIGAEVDGQKYQFKQPVSNMGQINQALQRATPVREIVKEAVFELSKAKKKGGRKKDPRLARAGGEGFNKPKRTPKHPTKSHIVVAKEGNKIKTIRYGQQGAKTAGDPKKGESEKMKKKRKSFKARHRKNIKRGKMSAAYWADRSKW